MDRIVLVCRPFVSDAARQRSDRSTQIPAISGGFGPQIRFAAQCPAWLALSRHGRGRVPSSGRRSSSAASRCARAPPCTRRSLDSMRGQVETWAVQTGGGQQIVPPLVAGRSSMRPFVGRDRELADLASALEEAASGRGSLVLVTGEPGIGKTRLMSELARVGSQRGVCLAAGRCWEEGGAPPYWPWMQVIRTLGGDL